MRCQSGRTLEATTILLVDDEQVVRELGRELLNEAGYRVMTAACGEEAIEMYRRRGYEISLVVLDLNMPKMSGWECLPELRKIDPSVCVLIWSGSPFADLRDERGEYDVFGYIPKSATPRRC